MSADRIKVSGSINDILVDPTKVLAAQMSIVEYSKKLENNISDIKKSVLQITDYWESPTATYYRDTLKSKVIEIENEQTVLSGNLSKYLSVVLKNYEATEKMIVKNADLFK